jgi:hypothetical protein
MHIKCIYIQMCVRACMHFIGILVFSRPTYRQYSYLRVRFEFAILKNAI